MRKVIIQMAISLDGYIEGPNGEYDWCFTDQDYGFTEFLKRIDTMLLGRRSYELILSMGESAMPGMPEVKEYVFSTTLTHVKPGAILIKEDAAAAVRKIKEESGKDIFLFGGASLANSLLDRGLVDELVLAVHPILLGSGKQLFEKRDKRIPLKLADSKSYSSGLVMLTYTLPGEEKVSG